MKEQKRLTPLSHRPFKKAGIMTESEREAMLLGQVKEIAEKARKEGIGEGIDEQEKSAE
jgi:hypothetical protein